MKSDCRQWLCQSQCQSKRSCTMFTFISQTTTEKNENDRYTSLGDGEKMAFRFVFIWFGYDLYMFSAITVSYTLTPNGILAGNGTIHPIVDDMRERLCHIHSKSNRKDTDLLFHPHVLHRHTHTQTQADMANTENKKTHRQQEQQFRKQICAYAISPGLKT